MNENGKVDRKKILSIIEQQYIDVQDESLFTEAEHKLAGIWKKILGIHSVAKESSFFEAGGDSLAATKLMTELKKQLTKYKKENDKESIALTHTGIPIIKELIRRYTL